MPTGNHICQHLIKDHSEGSLWLGELEVREESGVYGASCCQASSPGRLGTLRSVQALVIAMGDWCWEES